jgi:sulfatase maturation enzyme AslB (radical SAM superfamily)
MESMATTPSVSLSHLDHLWFQVAGMRCNLSCHHCFISCSPKNNTFSMLSLEQVRGYLQESVPLGVKEYYFTGGEPFLNPEMVPILVETLRYGPATVLTNGTVLKDEWLDVLSNAAAASRYRLEFRVSLDGFSAAQNDPIRGEGTFERIIRGLVKLVEFGFSPIVTAVRTWPLEQEDQIVGDFVELLRQVGYDQPRLKILPKLQLGAEAQRSTPYAESDRITEEMLIDYDQSQLLCEHSRIVSDRGVHVCPILIESPDSLLGSSLATAKTSFPLVHGACRTCYQHGAICSNSCSTAKPH